MFLGAIKRPSLVRNAQAANSSSSKSSTVRIPRLNCSDRDMSFVDLVSFLSLSKGWSLPPWNSQYGARLIARLPQSTPDFVTLVHNTLPYASILILFAGSYPTKSLGL